MIRFATSATLLATPLGIYPAIVPQASAELIVYEGFDYPTGELEGNDDGLGDWTDAWQHSGGFRSGPDWQVDSSGLSYTDAGGRSLVTSGGAARADAGGSSQEFNATRAWDTTGHMDDGDVLWFSYLFNRSEGDHGQHLYIIGEGTFRRGVGPFIGSSNSHIQARIQNSTFESGMETGGNMPFARDESHLVVGRITFSDTSDADELRYWLNPELDAVPLDDAANSGAVTGNINPTWSNFFVRNSGDGAAAIDEIRIGTEPTDVGIIPEPGSVALLGMGGLLLVWRRHVSGVPAPAAGR